MPPRLGRRRVNTPRGRGNTPRGRGNTPRGRGNTPRGKQSTGPRPGPSREQDESGSNESDESEEEDDDENEDEETDDEDESDDDEDKLYYPFKKNPKNKNPEYDRIWHSKNQGVGSKVPPFSPHPNLHDSQTVKDCKSPYEFWRLFMPDSFIQLMVEQSKIYAVQQGSAGKGNYVTPDTLLSALGVLLLSGYNCLPSKKMYWEEAPDTHTPIVPNSIRRDVFEGVLWSIHFANNEMLDPDDRFAKVRPIFDNLNRQAQLYLPSQEILSVNEMMIPYFGHHGDKQYIRGKPLRFGFKIWGICDSHGFTKHLEPYSGASTKLPDFGLGQGPNVVLGLCEKANVAPGTKVYFDNLFTSMPLLEKLSEMGVGGTGTIRKNRMVAIPLPTDKEMKKSYARGEYSVLYTEDVCVSAWLDNKPVFVGSNVHDVSMINY